MITHGALVTHQGGEMLGGCNLSRKNNILFLNLMNKNM